MAEKKKGRKRKDEYVGAGDEQVEKASKDEYAVAKWLRKNVQIKRTKFLNHNVEYFTAYKAVDGLMESHFGKSTREGEIPLFPNRSKAIEFLNTMLRHKFFHRAKKIPVTEQELKARRKGDKKKNDDEKKKDDAKVTDAENSQVEGKSDTAVEKEKRKRKVRLEMHIDQLFEDGMDAYVWMYDPVPVYYWFFGALLVLGAIAVCLFPLWPPSVRKGVYYLSLAAACFLVFIIGLVVLRFIVFSIVWLLSLGKHHFWFLPNLTEDVGFFASFWPLYHYQYKGPDKNAQKESKKKKKKKDKDSDAEGESTPENVQQTDKKDKESDTEGDYSFPHSSENRAEEKAKLSRQSTLDDDRTGGPEASSDDVPPENSTDDRRISESESESSQRSSTGRDFEIVDREDLDSAS